MTVRLRGDRLLVVPDPVEVETGAGVLLTDVFQRPPTRGEVVGVGPGRVVNGRVLGMTVGVGDRVLYPAHAGFEVEDGGRTCLVLGESEVMAVVE